MHRLKLDPKGSAKGKYKLHILEDVERKLRRCRVTIRDAIHRRLGEIAHAAQGIVGPVPIGPRFRFYVYEGYRVFYRVDPTTRQVVVLELAFEPAGTAHGKENGA